MNLVVFWSFNDHGFFFRTICKQSPPFFFWLITEITIISFFFFKDDDFKDDDSAMMEQVRERGLVRLQFPSCYHLYSFEGFKDVISDRGGGENGWGLLSLSFPLE